MKNFKPMIKKAGTTAAEVGVIGGAMILTKKFLDFEVIFPNVKKENFLIAHQGGVKLLIGAAGAVMVKNVWLKLAFVGMAVEGFIREARVLTTNKEGVAFFGQIGQTNEISEEDQSLLDAARALSGASNPTTEYPTTVGSVAYNLQSVDLQDQAQTFVSGMGAAGADDFGKM
jgi:hypothetical protein